MNLLELTTNKGYKYFVDIEGTVHKKECSECGAVKAAIQFQKQSRDKKTGLSSNCRECINTRANKNYKKRNPKRTHTIEFEGNTLYKGKFASRTYYNNEELETPVAKECTKCKEVKDVYSFYYYPESKTKKISSQCKACTSPNINHTKEVKKYGHSQVYEKKTQGGYIYHEKNGEVTARQCTICKEVKPIDDFFGCKGAFANKQRRCKICSTNATKKYRKENPEWAIQYEKKRYEENREALLEKSRRWEQENREKSNARHRRRRARVRSLPDTLTAQQQQLLMLAQNHECILTGDKENLDLEHFIPVSIGFGGTTYQNCYYMNSSLNYSKWKKNPFEWIKTQEEGIQERFYTKLVPMLAKRNKMNIEEFEAYVYECFESDNTAV